MDNVVIVANTGCIHQTGGKLSLVDVCLITIMSDLNSAHGDGLPNHISCHQSENLKNQDIPLLAP